MENKPNPTSPKRSCQRLLQIEVYCWDYNFTQPSIRGTDKLGGLKPLSKKGTQICLWHEGRIIGLKSGRNESFEMKNGMKFCRLPDLKCKRFKGT